MTTGDQSNAAPHGERARQTHADREPHGDGGASLVFWLLIALAFAVFAPCMILPAWREYQAADLTERSRAQELKAAEARANHLERRLDAIHNDPVVIARLARRELRCTLPGEIRLAANAPTDLECQYTNPWREDAVELQPEQLQPVEPPVIVSRLTSRLPRLNYDALFCDSPTRETLLAMSVALLAGAFIIFWPRCPRA